MSITIQDMVEWLDNTGNGGKSYEGRLSFIVCMEYAATGKDYADFVKMMGSKMPIGIFEQAYIDAWDFATGKLPRKE